MESAREAQNEKELLWEALRKNVDKTRLIVIHLTKDDKGWSKIPATRFVIVACRPSSKNKWLCSSYLQSLKHQ